MIYYPVLIDYHWFSHLHRFSYISNSPTLTDFHTLTDYFFLAEGVVRCSTPTTSTAQNRRQEQDRDNPVFKAYLAVSQLNSEDEYIDDDDDDDDDMRWQKHWR